MKGMTCNICNAFWFLLFFYRWLVIRLKMFGNFIVLFSSLFCVMKKDKISAGIAGLSISYAMQVSGILMEILTYIDTSDQTSNSAIVEGKDLFCVMCLRRKVYHK